MSETITITLTSNNYQSATFDGWVGNCIKVKDMKRTYAVVVKETPEPGAIRISTIWKYKPAPRSQLKNKTMFSKFKQPILIRF